MTKMNITAERINAAKNKRNHAVITAFESMGEAYWEALKDSLRRTEGSGDQMKISTRAAIPFSESLKGKKFTLDPLELVSIWSRIMETFPNTESCNMRGVYPKYNISTAIACAYGTQNIDSEEWKNLFKKITSSGIGPFISLTNNDTKNASIFAEKIGDIRESLKTLHAFYTRDRTGYTFMRLARSGDADADRILSEQQYAKQKCNDELLETLHENWGNGIVFLYVPVTRK